MARPFSAQPHAYSRGSWAGTNPAPGAGVWGAGPRGSDGGGPDSSQWAYGGRGGGAQHTGGLNSTAMVDVGGVTVSVYVAETMKRIVEANKWMQVRGDESWAN